jgi:hypothetical protein
MVFSGFCSFFTLRSPSSPATAAISTIAPKMIANAAQRGSQMSSSSARAKKRKNVL